MITTIVWNPAARPNGKPETKYKSVIKVVSEPRINAAYGLSATGRIVFKIKLSDVQYIKTTEQNHKIFMESLTKDLKKAKKENK